MRWGGGGVCVYICVWVDIEVAEIPLYENLLRRFVNLPLLLGRGCWWWNPLKDPFFSLHLRNHLRESHIKVKILKSKFQRRFSDGRTSLNDFRICHSLVVNSGLHCVRLISRVDPSTVIHLHGYTVERLLLFTDSHWRISRTEIVIIRLVTSGLIFTFFTPGKSLWFEDLRVQCLTVIRLSTVDKRTV